MKTIEFKENSAGCVDISGFRAAGVHCDIRNLNNGRLDLALIVSECPCIAAGVFTQNKMAAAPVRLCRKLLAEGDYFKGIVVNSGNANACTGDQGMQDALVMQSRAAARLGCEPGEVFVASTGRIGEILPLGKIEDGIDRAAGILGEDRESGLAAADAILTSDTSRKVCTVVVHTNSGDVRISGMAKGAGMIEPNMATMLAFIFTDAAIARELAQSMLKDSVNATFNSITVDGDESTNDTVLLLANGSSGIYIEENSRDLEDFKQALRAVCDHLARKIVGDGEKITKVVEIRINGATTPEDADKAARAIGNSLLVKSSWYGNDPNWGRVLDAVGYSGAATAEQLVKMWYVGDDDNRIEVFSRGQVFRDNKDAWKKLVARKQFGIEIDLGSGAESTRLWSTDLTEGYVNFNKSE